MLAPGRLASPTPASWALLALAAAGATATAWALWPVSPRLRAAAAAKSQIGRSDSSPYWADVLPGTPPSGYPADWCGAFALWALHQGGIAKSTNWIIGKGFLFDLPTTQDPQVGDVAYFDQYEHQAMVVGVDGDSVSLINGNGTGGAVSASVGPKSHVAAFYSIEPILADAPSDSSLPWIAASAVVLGAGAWVLLPSGK